MTVTMEALHRRLPSRERYALPPSELVAEMVALGLRGHKLPRRPHPRSPCSRTSATARPAF